MPTTLTSTGITFPDGTSQSAAAEGGGFKLSQASEYTSPGTFTKPANFGYCLVAGLGGGGGGANGGTGTGGGGGGGFLTAFDDSQLPSSVAYNVGGAGTVSYTNATGSGNSGGTTNFHNATANGGQGGNTSYQPSGRAGGTGAVNGSYIFKFTGTGGTGASGNRAAQDGQGLGGGGGCARTGNRFDTSEGGIAQSVVTSLQAGGGGVDGGGGGGYNPGRNHVNPINGNANNPGNYVGGPGGSGVLKLDVYSS